MKVVVDAMGGDYAPLEIVKGAIEAVRENTVEVILVGQETVIQPLLQSYPSLNSSVTVADAAEVIGSDEKPIKAIRAKRNSSLVVGMNLLRSGESAAFVSAGNTGAIVSAAVLTLGKIKGVRRPALSILLPTTSGFSLFLDIGANANSNPASLRDFAQIGTLYLERVFGINNPRVGLLSNGQEKIKGSHLIQKSHRLLQKSNLNFIGNLEGNGITRGTADVIITDGFTGNVVLKTMEGVSEVLSESLQQMLVTDSRFEEAVPLLKTALGTFAKKWDYSEYGGSLLLGINGNVIIAHGRSRAKAIKNAIHLAHRAVEMKAIEAIKNGCYDRA